MQPEAAVEVGCAVEAGAQGDLRDIQLALAQHAAGVFKARGEQVFARRSAGFLLAEAAQVGLAQAADAGKLGEGQLLGIVRLNVAKGLGELRMSREGENIVGQTILSCGGSTY